MTITDFLTRRPQTKRELAARMGIPPRDVEEAVRVARLAGARIVSDSDGYRMAGASEELETQARRLRIRAAHQFLTARAVRTTAKRMKEDRDAAMRPAGTLGLVP